MLLEVRLVLGERLGMVADHEQILGVFRLRCLREVEAADDERLAITHSSTADVIR